jgi:hypothetical protein
MPHPVGAVGAFAQRAGNNPVSCAQEQEQHGAIGSLDATVGTVGVMRKRVSATQRYGLQLPVKQEQIVVFHNAQSIVF